MRKTTVSIRRNRKGIAYILALLLLALFSALAAAMATSTNLNLCTSDNHRKMITAQMATESGMAFAMSHMVPGIDISSPVEPEMSQLVYDYFAEKLNGTANLDGCTVSLCNEVVYIPSISLGNNASFSFTVAKIDDTTMRMTVTGQANGCTRRASLDYNITESCKVLASALTSNSRVFLTEAAYIEGDICSTWDRTRISSYDIPPFSTDADTTVVGKLMTVLSQSEYDNEDGCFSSDYTDGQHQGMTYDVSRRETYTTDDFDTSCYKPGTVDITTTNIPDHTLSGDWFPSSTTRRRALDRPVYENQTFDNVYIPVGHNPKFINCTFNRITYVDSNETTTLSQWSHGFYDEHAQPGQEYRSDDRYNDLSNNVVFEGCTFNGPIVTAVPRDYWWSKNALTFEGTTRFTNTYMPESTILAPNFGVDIGGRGYDEEENSDSVLSGLIVGGIVDVRGAANIEGTILSMHYPDTDRGTAARYYGSNIGFLDDGGECGGATGLPGNIRILPQPDNDMPDGIVKRYKLAPKAGTYKELTQ